MKKNLLKSLLLVLMVLVGGSAWAADFDLSGYTLHKTYDFSGYTTETAIEIGSAVTTKCWDNGNGQLQTMYPVTSPANMEGLIVQSKANKGFIIGANSGFYSKGAARCAGIEGLSKGDLVVLTATQNIDNVISLIKTHSKGNNLPDGNYNFTKSNDGKVYYCAMTDDGYLGYHNLNGKQAISKIEIYKPNEGTNIANYTVKFVDGNGVDLLDAKTYSGAVGMQCNVFPADLQNITNNNIGYLVESNNASEKTIAADGSTVVTVTFVAVAPVAYTVNELSGEKIFRTTTGEAYTGSTIKVPYRYYNVADSLLYKKDATNKEFNYSFNLTQENQSENLSYTATGTKGIVFISEGEDIEGLTPCNSNNTAIRSSNSSSAYATEDTKIVTLAEGKYKIYTVIYDASKEPNSHWIFKAGAVEVADLNCTRVNFQELNSTEFAVGRETDIIMAKGGSNTMGLDLIYIQKTGDVTADEAEALNAAADSIAAIVAAKADFQADITAAKAIETEGKNEVEALADAITAAETAIAAEDATVESIAAAKAALAEAVTAFKVANFDIATAIANADFSADEVITTKICTYTKDVKEGEFSNMQPLTGWTIVENGDARAAGVFAYGSAAILGGDGGNVPAVGPNGETEGKVLGIEAVWSATTQYTQEVTLPAGEYLMEAVVYNAAGTGALSQNLIGIDGTYCTTKNYPVGKWTKDQVKITLAEAKTVTISLGVNSGNVGNGSAPHLFIDHVKLYGSEEIAAIELAAAKENALAEVNALTIGEVLFTYPEAAITTAKSAIESATTIEAVNAAVTTAKAAQSKPAADKAYAIANTTATGNLCITTEKVTVAKDSVVFFTEVDGGFVLSNKNGEYIFKTDNGWTLSTTTEIANAYVVTFVPVEGGYTIKGAKGLFGLDNTAEGSTVYADKTADKNGIWTISEAVEPVKTDYTDLIVNANLTNTETKGWDETETKGIDGSGIVKVSSGKIFDFNQTIANLPAGKYKVTAQAAYRYSDGEAREADSIAAGVNTKFAKLYATVGTTTVDTLVQNRYDGASETNLFNGEGGVSVVNEKYVPNSSDAVKAWFAAGKYVNEVVFNLPADGAVTIGIVKTQSPEESDYTVIGPWTLTRLGDAEVEPEPEPTPEPGTDMTAKIVNPSFEDGTTGWTYEPSNDHGAKENSNATYTMSNCDGNYIFNIWSSGNAISQKVVNLPNGVYKMKAVIATDANQKVQLNANDKSVQIEAVGKETGVEGELEFNVLDNTATIGAEGVNKYWYKVDNFRLTYVKGFDTAELVTAYETALAEAQAIEGDMNADVKTALDAAIATEVDKTNADALTSATAALTAAISAAKASVAAFAKAKEILPKMKELVEATNVYTAEAYENYYSKWVAKLDEKTLTAEEGNALQDPFIVTGWHASITVDNFLLSAWDTNPDFQDAPYYINSWSIEGENDGSNFKVPFFEYWTGDANSLGERTLTATMNGLEAGDYDVTAWVRVRTKNEAGADAEAYGITLSANEGEATDVTKGETKIALNNNNNFYLQEFTARGSVAEDGVLKIQFNVAADNNISWLSFKNVKFEKKPAPVVPIDGINYSWESPEGDPMQWGGTIAYVNGDGDRLNYKNADYYTICLNGKKANINDEAASADAGKMVITLDKPLHAGDTIAYTAYLNKNTSKEASAYILFENGTAVEGEVFGDEANIDAAFNGVPTLKYTIVPAEAAGSKTITLTRSKTGTNLFITKLQVIATQLELTLDVERYPGMGYGAQEATVDFARAKAYLGVEEITTEMLRIVNPNDSLISDYDAYDGWFNGEGAAETWGDNTKINVKFFQAIPEGNYTICDMNGADSIGAVYTVKWALVANDKQVTYTINVKFVEKPVIALTFADLNKVDEKTVALTSELGKCYEGLTADVDVAAILAKLEVASLNDVTIYAVQSDGSLDDNYKLSTTDGWRNAAGDWQTWGNDAYFFVKTDFALESGQIYAAGGMDGKNTTEDWENPATYTATYAFVKAGSADAVVLKVTLTYTVPTGINAIARDAQNADIYNINGQKVNKAQKGLYIINGRKVVIK